VQLLDGGEEGVHVHHQPRGGEVAARRQLRHQRVCRPATCHVQWLIVKTAASVNTVWAVMLPAAHTLPRADAHGTHAVAIHCRCQILEMSIAPLVAGKLALAEGCGLPLQAGDALLGLRLLALLVSEMRRVLHVDKRRLKCTTHDRPAAAVQLRHPLDGHFRREQGVHDAEMLF
jgi:hypothetical protein